MEIPTLCFHDKAVAAHDDSRLLATFDMPSVLQRPVSEAGALYYKMQAGFAQIYGLL